ncbi:MAG TPA: choice-of-anchor D domain-containing protein [Candidatus Kapabacteria bacterium]
MKKILLLLLVMLAGVSYAQPTFTTGNRNVNFGNIALGKTGERFIQFRVDSLAPAPVTVICSNPHDMQYTIIGDTQFTIEKGQFRNMTIEFIPMAVGQFADSLIFSHDGDTSLVRSPGIIRLNGTGVASDTFARMAIQPGFGVVQLGSVAVGNTRQSSFRIQNTTDTIRTLYGTITAPKPPFSIASNGEPFSLVMQDTVRVFIDFTPDTVGNFFDSVLIHSNADSLNSIRKVYLVGIGLPPGSDTIPRIGVTGIGNGGVNFGNVPSSTSTARYITIRNTSLMNKQLIGTVGNPTISAFTIDSGDVNFTLDSGASAVIKLRFSPSTAGTYRDSLYIVSNALEPTDSTMVLLRGVAVTNSITDDRVVTSISLYPNPAKDHVTSRITLSEPTTINISVFDTKGVEVLSIPSAHYDAGIPDVDFSVKALPNGIYTVRYSFFNSAVSILMVIER